MGESYFELPHHRHGSFYFFQIRPAQDAAYTFLSDQIQKLKGKFLIFLYRVSHNKNTAAMKQLYETQSRFSRRVLNKKSHMTSADKVNVIC